MSFNATFQTDSEVEAKLNPVQNIDAKFGEIYETSSSVDVVPLSVTENGTYTAPSGQAYSPVSVSVQSGVDVSDTTAVAGDVKSGKKFHLADGSLATGSYQWSWMGKDAECVNSSLFSISKKLSETDYATWTPSTTAGVIIPSTSLTAFQIDLGEYTYFIRYLTDIRMAYNQGTTLKSLLIRQALEDWYLIGKRPNTISSLEESVFDSNSTQVISFGGYVTYYNSSGGVALQATSVSNGIYRSMSAPTLNSTTGDTPRLTVKTNQINAKCSNSYLSTANAANVDQTSSVVKLRGELWRATRKGMIEELWSNAVNLWNNPL